MANYYTEASFIIPLTEEQVKFAFDVADCIQDERIDFNAKRKNTAAKSVKTDVYEIAKKAILSFEDYEPGCASLEFNMEPQPEGLWIYHDESINTNNAANFTHLLLKHFDLDVCVGIEASETCSKARLDSFGGHAAFVTKKGIKWMSTSEWIHKQIDAFNKRLAA